MDNIKGIVTGTIITLLIGGTAYNINQEDVIQNFADDTGMTQEQAELYIDKIPEEELSSWNQVGSDFINDGQELINFVHEIDCVNYEYEWESTTLSCTEGRNQIDKFAKDSILLGQAYKKLDSESASKDDISKTIILIDQLNSDYQLKIINFVLSMSEINEIEKTNSYNKALLKTVLESE